MFEVQGVRPHAEGEELVAVWKGSSEEVVIPNSTWNVRRATETWHSGRNNGFRQRFQRTLDNQRAKLRKGRARLARGAAPTTAQALALQRAARDSAPGAREGAMTAAAGEGSVVPLAAVASVDATAVAVPAARGGADEPEKLPGAQSHTHGPGGDGRPRTPATQPGGVTPCDGGRLSDDSDYSLPHSPSTDGHISWPPTGESWPSSPAKDGA